MIRAMIVDNSRMVRRVLREILESDPDVKVVEEAENGAEAADKCLSADPDLIIMDLQAVMDDLEAVERIRALGPVPVPIETYTEISQDLLAKVKHIAKMGKR